MHLVGSFYEIYITMHGSMNIKLLVTQLVNKLDALCVTARFTAVFACGPYLRKTIATLLLTPYSFIGAFYHLHPALPLQ